MKKILIINAHPDYASFGRFLAERYEQGALAAGHDCELVHLRDLDFNPMLEAGYRIPTALEPSLIDVQAQIKKAGHLVFIYPNWWGTFPAILKGFIDRVFLPGFAFKYRENSMRWDKLLKGKSARIIVTMDTPVWYYHLGFRAPGHNAMKRCLLKFSGVSPVKSTIFSPLKSSSMEKREAWLKKTENLGRKGI